MNHDMRDYGGVIISVVICTYNRSALLEGALRSLVQQTCERDRFEIIVVDNASSESTNEIFEKFLSFPNLFYIREEKLGLSYARNRGYRIAKGEYVAYMDDDARADRGWIRNILAFIRRHPDIVAFGGPYRGYSEVQIPKWFKRSYGSWTLGDQERPIGSNEWINGTNMIFKRTLLERLGGFDTKVGMSGNRLSYGEETGFLLKIKANEDPIFYVPDIIVDHFIPEYKLKLKWQFKSNYINGFSSLETFGFKKQPVRQCFMTIYACFKGLIRFLFCKEPYFKTRILESFSEFIWHLGLTVRMCRG